MSNAGMKRILAALLLLTLGAPAFGQDFDQDFKKAWQAYERGDYATALSEWRTPADHGIARAQALVGRMYYVGKGAPRNYAEAAKWYQKAAEQGDTEALSLLAYMYTMGQGVPQDYAEAIKWYRKAADQFDRGLRYYDMLGLLTQDYGEATEWYRQAAEQGDAGAQFYLGRIYQSGMGVPQDYVEATKWYRKAAEQGDATAQLYLGVMYSKEGVPQDYVQAHMWFNLSAAHGEKNATELRDDVAKRMTAAQIAEAQKLAREWLPAYEKPKNN